MAEGSEEAAWQLTELYSPHILRIVRSSLPSVIRAKVDSQDFLQSIWATMLLEPEDLVRFRDPGQFLRYLAGVAKNKVVDKYRHFSTQKNDVYAEVRVAAMEYSDSPEGEGSLLGQEPTPSQVVIVRENWDRVVGSSSERDQEIIALRLKGMTYESIAELLSIDERTARRAVNRIVQEFYK